MCEQEMSLWQEHEEVQLVPYRPAGQLMEQSSPWTQRTDRERLKHTDWLTLVGDIGDNKKSNLRVLYQDFLCHYLPQKSSIGQATLAILIYKHNDTD